jgi:autotransporter translocation and assembly factor TamB
MVVVILGVRTLYRHTMAQLPQLMESELRKSLNRDVRVQSVRVISSSIVEIKELRIANGNDFTSGTFLSAPKIIVAFRSFDVLMGRTTLEHSITHLTIYSPSLTLIRSQSRAWNFRDIFQKAPVPNAKRFRGSVRFYDADLTIMDYAAKTPTLPATNRVTGVNGTVNFGPARWVNINLSGKGEPGRFTSVLADGRWGINLPDTYLTLNIRNADAAYWLGYFAEIKTWRVTSGILQAQIVVTRPHGKKIEYSGTVTATNGKITSPFLNAPISPMTVSAGFVNEVIRLSGIGFIGRSQVDFNGSISGFANGVMDIKASANQMDLNVLQKTIKPLPITPQIAWLSPGIINAHITGYAANPSVTASMQTESSVLYGIHAANISMQGEYGNGVITVTNATSRVTGGEVSMAGTVGLKSATIHLSGTGSSINLAAIPQVRGRIARGTASGTFNLNYTHGLRSAALHADVTSLRSGAVDLPQVQVTAAFTDSAGAQINATSPSGTISGEPVNALSLSGQIHGNTLHVQSASGNVAGGTVTASGIVSLAGDMNLDVNAKRLDLASALAPLGFSGVSGTADVSGALGGTVGKPNITARVSATKGVIKGLAYDSVSAQMTADSNHLILTNADFKQGTTSVSSQGRIQVSRNAPVSFDTYITASNVDVGKLATEMGYSKVLEGTASGSVTVVGRFPNVQASGSAEIVNGKVSSIPFDSARVQLQSSGGRTLVTEFTATRNNMSVSGNGYIEKNGGLSANLTASNLDLSLLNPLTEPYADLSGSLSFAGSVSGAIENPTVSGNVASENLTINKRNFTSLTAPISWNGSAIQLTNASLISPTGQWRLADIQYNPRDHTFATQGSISSESITGMVDMLSNSQIVQTAQGAKLEEFLGTMPSPFTGSLDASFNLIGGPASVSGTARLSANNVHMGSSTLSNLTLQLTTPTRNRNEVSLTAVGAGVNISAQSNFIKEEPTDFTATISNSRLPDLVSLLENAPALGMFDFGIRLVNAARSIPTPIEGVFNANVSMSEIETRRSGRITLNGQNISLEGTKIGQVTADAGLSGQTFTINNFDISPPNGHATLHGTIGIGGLIDLTGSGTGLPLALAQPFIKGPSISGNVDFTLLASGQISNPAVEASINASNVRYNNHEIDGISVPDITIAANRISAHTITITDRGSVLTASGSAPFVWSAPFIPPDQPLNAHVTLNDQDLALALSVTSGVKQARGILSSSVDIEGTINDPELSGNLSLQNGFLRLDHMGNDFTNLNIAATFKDAAIILDSFTGASSQGGSFDASGNISLASSESGAVAAIFILNSLVLDETGLVGGGEHIRATGTGQLTASNTLAAPLVQGALVVRDADVTVPGTTITTSLQAPELPINPSLDITLNLTQNVHIQRGGLAALIDGPVTVTGTAGHPVASGTVAVVTGRIKYANTSLELTPGSTSSFVLRPGLPIVMSVDAQAKSRIVAANPLTGRPVRYVITLFISGPIGDLKLDAISSPPGLSRSDAIQVLFGGVALAELTVGKPFQQVFQDQIGGLLLGYAIPGVFQPLELGPLTLAVEPGITVPLTVSASTSLTDKLTLTYSQSLAGGLALSSVGVSYAISDYMALTLEEDILPGGPNSTVFLVQYFTRFD